ncbi:hypothetical protein DIPPA_08053 [Diplonema papillatum]|nr:hypothetical protein DIPPA_08053 [Diplonema papillatum]
MADLMAAVSGRLSRPRRMARRSRIRRTHPAGRMTREERELCWDDGGGGAAGSKAEKADGKSGKGKANAGEDDGSGGGNGVAKQEASDGKQGKDKKKKKRNGGWIEVSGKKDGRARDGRGRTQEGTRKRKASRRCEEREERAEQEDWGVPVVDHTELAEATVALAPMAGARKTQRAGIPEGSAVVTVAALEGSRRTDVVCRIDGAEKVLPVYVSTSPEGRETWSTAHRCALVRGRDVSGPARTIGGRVPKTECKRLAEERVTRVFQLVVRVEEEQVGRLLRISGRRGLFLRVPRWKEGSETSDVVWLADDEASLKSALVLGQGKGCLGFARSRARERGTNKKNSPP